MRKKRNAKLTAPAGILGEVVTQLESDSPEDHQWALLTIASHGVLVTRPDVRDHLGLFTKDKPLELTAVVRAELQRFLRMIVRERGRQLAGAIATVEPLHFEAGATNRGEGIVVVDGELRDILVVQLVLMVATVGVEALRICEAPDCQRLFVKTHRREFCSERCQKRKYMRVRRANERKKRERSKRPVKRGK